MTLAQLRYVITVSQVGTLSEAAKRLYISQPSLTNAIKELEKELGITIFIRTNKGVILSRQGEEFLGYARQVIEQTNLIEEKYLQDHNIKHEFCISTQHYSFAVEAFVSLIKEYGGKEYDFRIRETQTYEIIEDVAKLKSEIGVLYLNSFNEVVLKKTLKENDLTFHRLFIAKPHVFLGKDNPLANKNKVSLEDLKEYPRLSYEQGEHNSFYFSEEILSTLESQKEIKVCDRATLFNLLIGLNGYTICSGVINKQLNGKDIIAVPLDVNDFMEIGYITHNKAILSRFGQLYIDILKEYTKKELFFDFTSGGDFPSLDELRKYALVVHCGACMLNEREVHSRLEKAEKAGVSITNYGIAIAQMHGILRRSLSPFPQLLQKLRERAPI